MKKLMILAFTMALSPLSMTQAQEAPVLPHNKMMKQFLELDRREQAQVDKEAYRSKQPTPEARRELAQEMRQLRESKRAPASK